MPKHNKNRNKKLLSSELDGLRKAKVVKGTIEKKTNINHNHIQPHAIWSINSIISNIFKYVEFRCLVEFNTVCKRWNHLSNPILYRNIKLSHDKYTRTSIFYRNGKKAEKTNDKVDDYIIYNSKHAKLIKELEYSEILQPRKSVKFFEIFKFITKLVISSIEISQDEFIGILKPLNLLEDLKLSRLNFKKCIEYRLYAEAIQLPFTLKKLAIKQLKLTGNNIRFIQTVNSHSNLEQFSYSDNNQIDVFNPFTKSYPSLQSFEYRNRKLESPQFLFNLISFNPQLLALKLCLSCYNSSLLNHIAFYLKNLKEFSLFEKTNGPTGSLPIYIKLSHSISIKKLELNWDKLSSCSLEKIINNCPCLEELILDSYNSYLFYDSPISLKLFNSTNILKLKIACYTLSKPSIESVLINCPHLKELDIQLPEAYKQWFEVIGVKCDRLEQLTIRPFVDSGPDEIELLYHELCKKEFFSNNSIYKTTLTHLTLDRLNFNISKYDHFKNFIKLKFIKFSNQEVGMIFIDENLWPNFRLRIHKNYIYLYDIDLIKI